MLSKPFTEGKMKEVMTALDGVTTFIPSAVLRIPPS